MKYSKHVSFKLQALTTLTIISLIIGELGYTKGTEIIVLLNRLEFCSLIIRTNANGSLLISLLDYLNVAFNGFVP